jgi:uncharacterized membrane protein
MQQSTSTRRLAYLDWLRGVAAIIMLQGHVYHSFTGKPWREGPVYVLSQFVGGLPPAIFLFLTGITLAFLMDSAERKGSPPQARVSLALRRAGYLFAAAYLFRLQLWLFGQPTSPWTDLLKVDILNCMGLGIALLSLMSVFTTMDRIRLCGALGIAIAAVSPFVSNLNWTRVPVFVKAYLAPDYNYFGFFPWAAFLAFGMSAGSLLRIVSKENVERLMQWTALGGLVLIVSARYAANLPYSIYSRSDFWLDSPALTFIKTGIILVMLSLAYLWTTFVIRDRWNWVCQLGMTSLLVYWVHVELVYGRWFWLWKENLTVTQTTILAAAVILLMVALSVTRTNWKQIRAWWNAPVRTPAPEMD